MSLQPKLAPALVGDTNSHPTNEQSNHLVTMAPRANVFRSEDALMRMMNPIVVF